MSLAKAIKVVSCTLFVFLRSKSDNVLLVLSATRYGKLETETENSKHRRHGFSNLLSTWLILFLSCANLCDIVITALSWNNILWRNIAHVLLSWYDNNDIVKPMKKHFRIFRFWSEFYTNFFQCLISLHDEEANFSEQLYIPWTFSPSLFFYSLHLARFLLLLTTTFGLKTSLIHNLRQKYIWTRVSPTLPPSNFDDLHYIFGGLIVSDKVLFI